MKKALSKAFYPLKRLFQMLGDFIYDIQVKIRAKRKPKEIKGGIKRDKIKDFIFYWSFMIIPFILFIISKIIINLNSFYLAFQKTETVIVDGMIKSVTVWAGLENFVQIFTNFATLPKYGDMMLRSIYTYLISLCTTPISIILGYYIYKKGLGSNLFKVLLFLPTILSSIVTVTVFRVIAMRVIPEIWEAITGYKPFGLLKTDPYATLLFYSLWMGLGGSLLTNLAAMNTVDPSVSEAAQLDGVGFLQEFWHVVFPAAYQVITLGFITGVISIFSSTLNLYAFYGSTAPEQAQTIGYFIQVETIEAEYSDYHYLSAWGLFITAIALPITLTLKHFIYTYGPSEVTREKKFKKN